MSRVHLEYRVSVLGPDLADMLPAERKWTLVYLPHPLGLSRDAMAEDAARTWWLETDQSEECEVVLLFEGGLRALPPTRFVRKVLLEIRTVGVVKRLGKEEAEAYQRVVAAIAEAAAREENGRRDAAPTGESVVGR